MITEARLEASTGAMLQHPSDSLSSGHQIIRAGQQHCSSYPAYMPFSNNIGSAYWTCTPYTEWEDSEGPFVWLPVREHEGDLIFASRTLQKGY